jgi:ectoine hydroxylase-related dioxygenase (phytanoyl-CoA dioxygenase family)
MPGSHRLGPLAHDLAVGKKRVPGTIFGNPIRMIEMRKGDLLLFNALLLHSGNLNLSAGIRYSVQARYTPLGAAADEGMGGVIRL